MSGGKPPSCANYLDWLLSIPVETRRARVKKDLKGGAGNSRRRSLRPGERVKERIVEYLAVQQARQQADRSDPVPGRPAPASARPRLGKVDRQGRPAVTFVRVFRSAAACVTRPRSAATGAPNIGSDAGKVIQSMRKAEVVEPAVPARRGSTRWAPTSAATPSIGPLLEVLDPRARTTPSNDHYLGGRLRSLQT